MKFLLGAALVASATAISVSTPVVEAFNAFAKKYGKDYTSDEWATRLGVFADNLERVNKLNAEHIIESGEAVHGVTKFMDLTPAEFKAQYLTYIPSNSTTLKKVTPVLDAPALDEVDWRTKGVVTPVKDQGRCGSCWAFSATEAIESYGKLSGKYDLLELSPQQVTSCDHVDLGCNGGNTESAYDYIKEAGGLELEADYPYTSGKFGADGQCKFDNSSVAVQITGFTSIKSGENHLKTALNNGPVSVCLAAESFQTYSSGILKVCRGEVDHCVQAVGYSGDDYWIVRNSWGTVWGEDGFIRVAMGKDLCEISDDVTFPEF